MKTFPTLYKKSGRGALQQWTILAGSLNDGTGVITTEHGQVGGKLQASEDFVREGKNPGKKNATTPIQQAELEAEAKWTKKQEREGYVADQARAEAGETDAEGGIPPMLAKTFEDVKPKHKIFPAHGQRKLNGVRCIVQVDDGNVSLWSRKRKPILGVPHILAAYAKCFANVTGKFKIDGELYRHGWSLQKISGFVRKDKTKPGFELISHNVYDLPEICTEASDVDGSKNDIDGGPARPWIQRQKDIDWLFANIIGDQPEIKKVETIELCDEAHMEEVTTAFIKEGYEGLMYRNLTGKYEPDVRSYFLLKVKRWQDAEFPILAVNEGRGKFAGLAVFTCKTEEGKEFDCCAPGNFEDREEFFRQGDKLIGKMLTVKFFEWTDDKRPAFPVGMAVRDYE